MINCRKSSSVRSHSAIEFRLICECTSVFVSCEKYGKEIIESKKKGSQFSKHGIAHVDGRVACMNFFQGTLVRLPSLKCLIFHPKLVFG